ncbi:MAG: branched-chain amino acid aminotransferase [Ignavibacteriaceae bacterium]|nr:branched-chain amino acid aminotransferase [Ignavibacteriaceae bacterium]
MEKLKINIAERTTPVVLSKNLGFGLIFTDHVFEMDYAPEKGWHNASIKPLKDLSMHPATMFIHYGQAVFEGLKAFKTVSGEVVIFRPEKHMQRLNNSSKRICIPQVDIPFVLNALNELIEIDKDWIPTNKYEALYIRPFIFGSDPFLGVKPSTNYKLIIILSPVGAYYPEGFKPVKILVQDDYVRAVRKGLGECKTPANYAASLLAAEEAKKKGYTQVLWLDGIEQKYIEEVGTMNIFIRFRNEVATPKLTGSILPGVTRDSVIQILKDWGMKITERLVSIDEIINGYKNGDLLEIFGTGTAAIISSVSTLGYKDLEIKLNTDEPGELALKLFEELTSIHSGIKEDKHNWLTYVERKPVEII